MKLAIFRRQHILEREKCTRKREIFKWFGDDLETRDGNFFELEYFNDEKTAETFETLLSK